MTVAEVDVIVATSILAAVGDSPVSLDKLVAYVGLNPSVRQSDHSAPVHGRLGKAGCAHVRGGLVESAWAASHTPGPLRAFYCRSKARRCFPRHTRQLGREQRPMCAAVVATAPTSTVLSWHLVIEYQDYAFARPGLVSHQRRSSSWRPTPHHSAATATRLGRRTTTNKSVSNKNAIVEQVDRAYEVLIGHWQTKKPTPRPISASLAPQVPPRPLSWWRPPPCRPAPARAAPPSTARQWQSRRHPAP